ncbi:hypothetical protein LCM20_12940 [Halobacillus litoralis]|uniref:hypothetical protein n=1 Tax=Halobacillus litoralis TaxID=45668 RepID=UPI001CD480D8|nr:hypothetical protein [Halobacillus litoralis]MCA0971505.1 hypothetical protein [Halobacillus litoralis]
MKNKVFGFTMILTLVFAALAPSVHAENLEDPQNIVFDEITDFRLENIGTNEVNMTFDTKNSDNGLDIDRLFYVVVESDSIVSSGSNNLDRLVGVTKSSGVLGDLEELVVDNNDAHLITNPELLLDLASGDVVKTGVVNDLQGGVENAEINLDGLEENVNYKMFVVGATPEMGVPQIIDSPDGFSDMANRFLKIHLSDDNGTNRTYEISYYDQNGNFHSQDVDDINSNTANDGDLRFGINNDGTINENATGGQRFTLRVSTANRIAVGDSWLLEFDDDGDVYEDPARIRRLPKAEYIDDGSEWEDGHLFADGDHGYVSFSTDPFPRLLPGIGTDGTGFSIDEAPTEQEFNYLRGVYANTRGSVSVRFDNDIKLTPRGQEQIQILDSEGNDYRYYEAFNRGISDGGSVLEIEYEALDPNKEYYVSIPAGSLATEVGNDNGLGQFNLGNEFNKLIFYTEKKPTIATTFFNPGNETFDHTFSPFSLNPSNDIYRIPELVGVNKLGVGLNQQLILNFQDAIILNGNPNSKLEIDSSGSNRNLSATATVNESRPNELIITVQHGLDNQNLLRPDTIYDLVIQPGIVKDRFGGSSYSESDTIEVSFKTADGFKNAFLDKSAYELNSGLLQTPSHNIAIDVPKVFIRNVETIHYRQGLAPDAQVAPNLTNVDVEADADVEYLTVSTNQDERRMLERGANGKFTATFAGLSSNVTQLEITAYDVNENELVTRVFRLQGAPGSEFNNEYVPEITDIFGERVSLYELMQQPDLMRQVLEQIPVSELDRIGVLEPFFAPYNDVP